MNIAKWTRCFVAAVLAAGLVFSSACSRQGSAGDLAVDAKIDEKNFCLKNSSGEYEPVFFKRR